MYRIPTTRNTLQLLSNIRRGQWFVHDYESLLPLALSFLQGERNPDVAPLGDYEFSTAVAAPAGTEDAGTNDAKVAVIPIVGTITKYDTCCNYGALTYARAITRAAADPLVRAIVLDVDSGGGATNAIAPFKEAIQGVQAQGMPIIVHADLCASLAYWIASQCDAIFCDNNLSAVGSIGGYFELVDDKNKLEKEGYTVVSVYADESPDKNLSYRQAIEGDTAMLRADLSHSIAQFHRDVKAGRPELRAEAPGVLTGAMFHPQEAQALGMINGVMTLTQCIENAAARAIYNL